MGVKLVQAGTIPIRLTVSIISLDFWGLMSKLLLIIGGCFVLTLSLAVAYVVYKWRRRQLGQGRDLRHF